MARILLVAADTELAGSLFGLLSGGLFEVEIATNGETGFSRGSSRDFDLIILDTATACARLRKMGVDAAVLMLSSRSRAEDRVVALRLGADDCVPRSCDPNELLARVEALLRRAPKTSRGPLGEICFGNVEIDFVLAGAWKDGAQVHLSGKELLLLQYLASHRERVVSRKELLSNVWEYDASVSSRTIDVHVGWLRQKLEDDPQHPKHIKTIRGRGYRFDGDDTALTFVDADKFTKVS